MVRGGFLPCLAPEPPNGGERAAAGAATLPPPEVRRAGVALASPGASGATAARAPLTEGQKQIWALATLDEEGGRAYNQSVAIHLRGPLSHEALAASLQKVVARHEALRATFSPDGDYQEIAPAVEIPVPVLDLTRQRDSEREAEAARLLGELGREAFDCAHGPLLRARLLRLASDHHVFALTMHHIVSDGWSMGIILRELEEFYAAERSGRPVSLRPPDSFVEYALSEAARRSGPEAEEAERYWLGQFAPPLPPTLGLPTDRPRSAVQTYVGAQQHMALDDELYLALKRLSASLGCTLFMTLLAGFKVLLHHLTGEQDIVVGTPSAGQLAAESFNLVGYCVNLLPLRSRIMGQMTFAEYLGSLKRILSGAYDHQSYPYGVLLKRLNLPRVPGRSPLVEAIFNLDHGLPPQKFFDLEMELRPIHNG
ncbi:MAG: non-ribosomal peptide synthetase, partial [Acidobacteria bacterium]